MKLILYLGTILIAFCPWTSTCSKAVLGAGAHMIQEEAYMYYTSMEALDMVMQRYAANFDKVYYDQEEDTYYYKLPGREFYLVYEGAEAAEQYYLIHLYEFVEDDPELAMGHTVTYGWYAVDKETGVITEQTGY